MLTDLSLNKEGEEMSCAAGKIRRLKRLQDDDGIYKILAIDHREVYVDMMNKSSGKKPGFDEVVKSKLEIISSLSRYFGAVLTDPIYCAAQSIEENALPQETGLLVSIEGNDYSTNEFKDDYLMEGVSVKSIVRMGADCVKLFVFYHPDSDIAKKQDDLVRKISKECDDYGMAFLLEPIPYSLNGKEISPKETTELIIKSAEHFSSFDIDIYKIPFPGDTEKFSKDENINICKNITGILPFPWIVLSSGIDESSLEKQLEIASVGGAKGYAIGRTLWRKYIDCTEDKKEAETENMIRNAKGYSLFFNKG